MSLIPQMPHVRPDWLFISLEVLAGLVALAFVISMCIRRPQPPQGPLDLRPE